jgi:murein DD-endopeptidase MepM/ murein hydrolase activator NlpD
MRRGVWLLVLGIVAAALGAASAYAEGTTTTGTTTTTTSTPSYARLIPAYLPSHCVGAGAAAIAEPGRKVLTVGTPASARGPSEYPGKAPFIKFDSSSASGSTCKASSVTLGTVSLLGGRVTASSVAATHGHGTVSGLEIDGSAVSLSAGQTAPVGYWAQVTLGKTVGRLTAPLVVQLLERHGSLPAGTTIAVAFAATHAPVSRTKTKHHQPATTTQGSGNTRGAGSQTKAQRRQAEPTKEQRHKKHVPQPLKVTPPLGFKPEHYVFPVDGGASYIDTYGANRSDIYDGWHHGDDLFAPLGTPVVAVANGDLSLVGWNELGGWRLWLTDADGNSFYYAHLAGYSRWILKHRHVRAGQVVGFLGRTGDAFTTMPHLHFEIHPHQLLSLGYDGAVDPTAYLEKWKVVHVPKNEIPRPAKLRAPRGSPAQEATVVWHQLLAARHLLPTSEQEASAHTIWRPNLRVPRGVESVGAGPLRLGPVRRTADHVASAAAGSMAPWLGGGLSAALLFVLSAGAFTVRRRRRTASG